MMQKFTIGETVVVFGAGGIGLNIIQASSMVSAYKIIAVDLYDNRLELASKMGATHLINAQKQDAFEAIKNILGDVALDVFIDNTGQVSIIEEGYKLISPQGRLVLVGVPTKGNSIQIYSLPLHFGKKLIGSHGGQSLPHIDIPKYMNLYNQGLLSIDNLITKTYTLDKVNEAILSMRDGTLSGRCNIIF